LPVADGCSFLGQHGFFRDGWAFVPAKPMKVLANFFEPLSSETLTPDGEKSIVYSLLANFCYDDRVPLTIIVDGVAENLKIFDLLHRAFLIKYPKFILPSRVIFQLARSGEEGNMGGFVTVPNPTRICTQCGVSFESPIVVVQPLLESQRRGVLIPTLDNKHSILPVDVQSTVAVIPEVAVIRRPPLKKPPPPPLQPSKVISTGRSILRRPPLPPLPTTPITPVTAKSAPSERPKGRHYARNKLRRQYKREELQKLKDAVQQLPSQ
jgi:hypothetical protein